jgi:hypothetical protein
LLVKVCVNERQGTREDMESAVQEKRSIPAIWFYISILVEILEHAVVTFRGCVKSDG